jgi:hypothetical protein
MVEGCDGLISMSRYESNPNRAGTDRSRCPVILSDIPAHREIAMFRPRAGTLDDVRAPSAAMAARRKGSGAAAGGMRIPPS